MQAYFYYRDGCQVTGAVFGLILVTSATRVSPAPVYAPGPKLFDPMTSWVALAVYLCAVVLILVLCDERYRFSEQGVVVYRFCFRRKHLWSDFEYCGLMPYGVLIGKEACQEKQICISKSVPVPGKKMPKGCYEIDYTPELYEILFLLAPKQFLDPCKSGVEPAGDHLPQHTPEELLRSIRALDCCYSLVFLPALLSFLFVESIVAVVIILVLSVWAFVALGEHYFMPRLDELSHEYQVAYLHQLRTN